MKYVEIISDEEGNIVVLINDIVFTDRQNIDWKTVEIYLKKYVEQYYIVLETSDSVYVGRDFPKELKGSIDTKRLKGGNAKAKANATTKLPLLINTATNKRWSENFKQKHSLDARYGWYRYTSRFAIPIYEQKNIARLNIFRIEILVRHSSDGKLYLYDIVNIKKEKETKYPI